MDITDICRFCGDFKPFQNFTSILDDQLKLKLEYYFKITIDCDESLPNIICNECLESVDKCCEFVQKILDVQEKLKAKYEELNASSYNEIEEFQTFELQIERLDKISYEKEKRVHRKRKSNYDEEESEVKEKNQVKRNRGIKMSREVVKYTMEDLFKVRFMSENYYVIIRKLRWITLNQKKKSNFNTRNFQEFLSSS